MAAVIKRETNKRMHVVIIILLLTGCVKDAEFSGDTNYPSLETLAVTDINKDGATLNGIFHSHGKTPPNKLWFRWECPNCPGYTYSFSDTVAFPLTMRRNFPCGWKVLC